MCTLCTLGQSTGVLVANVLSLLSNTTCSSTSRGYVYVSGTSDEVHQRGHVISSTAGRTAAAAQFFPFILSVSDILLFSGPEPDVRNCR
ncbi:hypothetical protein BGW80DRAFT_141564 [Lactifluus volemus]|nr:hypothetical protein BGW80DRAFT_141564 [Lactifluus volemus]